MGMNIQTLIINIAWLQNDLSYADQIKKRKEKKEDLSSIATSHQLTWDRFADSSFTTPSIWLSKFWIGPSDILSEIHQKMTKIVESKLYNFLKLYLLLNDP